MTIPEDTDLEELIAWWKAAGIEKAVCMGQDMTKTWNTEFGEQYVRECYKKHPEFFIPFAAIEPIDRAGRFHQEKYEYMVESVDGFGVKGLLFTPPFGQYYANSNLIYPFYEFAQQANGDAYCSGAVFCGGVVASADSAPLSDSGSFVWHCGSHRSF